MNPKPWSVLRFNEPNFARKVGALNRHAQPDAARVATVAEIIATVREKGDDALVKYAKQWDKVDLSHGGLLLPSRRPQVAEPVRAAVEYAINNIKAFSKLRKPRSWSKTNREGATVGEKFDPLERVGIYVPGGTAPLVSTALMTVTLAKEAGVREIVAVTPPPVNETLHYALRLAGATEIFQVGGAQAIAALAYGTGSIARVQKIFGPGNAFVVEAKRQVVGAVAIDQLPGPSEIAIVADDTARADFITADLLAQAEHGAGSQILFLTASAKLLTAVETELARQSPLLSRGKHLAGVLEHGCLLILVEDVGEAIGLVEDFAPEQSHAGDQGGAPLVGDDPQCRRDFHRKLFAGGRGRFYRRAEPRPAHGRCGEGLFRADHRPVFSPNQHCGISATGASPRSLAHRNFLRGGAARCARALDRNPVREVKGPSGDSPRHGAPTGF